jgi:Tfp pilus assembly protein PilN
MSTPTGSSPALTLPPPELATADRTLRVPAIAANLLPIEIVDSRRERKVRRVVLAALAAFVAVLVAWYGLMSYQTAAARTTLTNAEADSQSVLRQQRAFADVVSVQAESGAITSQLAALLATDLQWPRVLAAVAQAAPAGVVLTDVSGALASTTDAAAGVTVIQLPNTSGERPVGTLTVAGLASSAPAVAAYVDALAKIKGLGNPLLGDVTLKEGKLKFTVQLDLTSGALGGRYSAAGGAAPGGN